MDLLATILTCSLYASDDALVRAIAEGPAASNPYAVVNPASESTEVDAPPPPVSEKEAVSRAHGLLAGRTRPLLGLLLLPPAWLDAFGQPLTSAFDPCINVAIGTAMLSQFDYECADSRAAREKPALERTNRRACVLRKYEAALGAPDFAEAVQLELSAQVPLAAHVADAPIFAPAAPRHWGPDQLLVPLVVATTPAASGSPPSP
jgi:hypothetical protein